MRSDILLDQVRGPKVLDVGCTGHVVKFGAPEWLHGRLRERFDDVSGIDIIPKRLRNNAMVFVLTPVAPLEQPARYEMQAYTAETSVGG